VAELEPETPAEYIRRVCADHELETVFQPLVELETNTRIAYEALTRFPGEPEWATSDWFIAASDLGEGEKLELAAVAAALAHLEDIPGDAALAINASPAVASTDEFFYLVAPFAHRIIIELTEYDPVDDYDALVDQLAGLRELGARIAVDDVGAGFATLRHILRLAPDIVKLDLSLTRGIAENLNSRALTSALVGYGEHTGALVAAEGIESAAELAILRELGVQHGQGYLLGRPASLKAHLN
jgi:EAL domain-containing protein (putative c-di-GMP-specific phosphodiesterase class I)